MPELTTRLQSVTATGLSFRRSMLRLLTVCLITAGCHSSSDDPSGENSASTGTPDGSVQTVVSLESCLAELQPDEFGINVPVELPLSGLNEWAEVDLADRLNPLVDEDQLREDLSLLLDDTLVERVLRRRFVTRDATHARDAIWAQHAVSRLRTPDSSAAARVYALFYHAMHTVQLTDRSLANLPLGPYEAAYFGQGTAAERAWAFATLLHELKVPTAIVRLPEAAEAPPGAGATEAADVRLAGVLLDGSLHLFDVVLGLPVPAPSDPDSDAATPALPQRAATLSQAIADDSLLRQLDLESDPYPVTADQLSRAHLDIIGDTTLWSRRMEGLSEALTGEQSVTLHRPLVAAGDQDGTYDAIRDALSSVIPADRIGIWMFPEQRREAHAVLDHDQEDRLQSLQHPFHSPFPITQIGPDLIIVRDQIRVPRLSVGTGWRYLLKARTSQLLGQTADAISLYTRVQGFSRLPPTLDPTVLQSLPPEIAAQFGSGNAAVKTQLSLGLPEPIRKSHQYAGEAAQFWRAVCQVEKRDWTAAADGFELYLRNNEHQHFTEPARLLMAISLASNGEFRRALAFLRTVSPTAPQHATAQQLIKRWSSPDDTSS